MTLTNSNTSTVRGKSEVNAAYITAASLDTTATANGNVIDNTDGRISFMSAMVYASNKTGTSPTLTLTLQGSTDGTNFVALKNQSGSTIATSALDISGADSTPVSAYIDTQQSLRQAFPPYLRWSVAVGGSASPGWTGVVSTETLRDKFIHT